MLKQNNNTYSRNPNQLNPVSRSDSLPPSYNESIRPNFGIPHDDSTNETLTNTDDNTKEIQQKK